MKSAKYKQIAERIEQQDTFEDLERMRALVSAYKKQNGNVNIKVLLEEEELIKMISDKQHDINREDL
jgi:hypothetical protein